MSILVGILVAALAVVVAGSVGCMPAAGMLSALRMRAAPTPRAAVLVTALVFPSVLCMFCVFVCGYFIRERDS